MAARHWRAAGAHRVRPRHVLVHLFAFLQSCARQHLLRDHGNAWLWFHIWWWRIPSSISRFTPPLRRISRSACGRSTSAGIFATRPPRSRSSCLGLSIPLLLASHFGVVRSAGFCSAALRPICDAAVRLLGFKAVHDRGAVRAVDGGVDARLHRTLFLAAAEAVFQMGGAHPARGRGPAAAACDDRRASRRARGHRARQAAAMARPEFEAHTARRSAGSSTTSRCFIFRSLTSPRSDWCSRRAACVHCSNAAAACSRCPIPTGRSGCRRA